MKYPHMTLDDLPITYQQQIPENYRDEMGHMNVMWYTYLFSMAFEKFAGQFGFDEAYMRANMAGSFALEVHTRYLAEVHVGSRVTVRTRLLGRSAKRFHFMHFMVNERSGALAATQEHVGAHIDMRTRRMAPFPESITTRYDKLLAEQNALPWPAPVCGVMKP